jgi:hypothetical protein
VREQSRHPKRILGVLLGCVALAALISGCGGSKGPDYQFSGETAGEYPVEVVRAEFRPRQRVAETYDLVLGVRNAGDETIPAVNATIDLPGRDSVLAFAYRNEQEGLAQAQRPIWVLEEGYPKLAGTVGPGGTQTSNRRTFNFGELLPDETANMVWRVTAVRAGPYRVSWKLSAGLGLDIEAVDATTGSRPEGVFPVRISGKARLTEVDENGNVVPLSPARQRAVEQQEAD